MSSVNKKNEKIKKNRHANYHWSNLTAMLNYVYRIVKSGQILDKPKMMHAVNRRGKFVNKRNELLKSGEMSKCFPLKLKNHQMVGC